MKIAPLPEIDLARIAPLPRHQKLNALEQQRVGHPPYSYKPLRKSLSDITNVQADLAGPMPRLPWRTVAAVVADNSKSDAEEKANLQVAQGVYDFANASRLIGRSHSIFPFLLGVSRKVMYWQNAILTLDGRPVVSFYDPRKAKSLTAEGRRFVFSVMHERIRAADPDFADVGLVVFQFERLSAGPRTVVPHEDLSVERFSFDDLDQMVSETYSLWQEICEDRAADVRAKKASGGKGTLF